MDILFALLAFLFMLFFLSTIHSYIKDTKKQTSLTFITSALFGMLFWVCMFIFTS